jgi:DNA mismatch repair ATPase MutS
MGLPAEFDQIKNGVAITIKVLNDLRKFLALIQQDRNNPFHAEIEKIDRQVLQGSMAAVFNTQKEPGIVDLFRTDHLLRNALHRPMNELLEFMYKLDLFLAVGAVGRRNGWTYATALPAQSYVLEIEDFRHPAISKAVGNTLSMDQNSNVLFLTGANMAGKSTLMKSFGIAVYLAHMGFPVPVKDMRFSVKDGIITSINVPDDLNKGFSHFYAEVLRVKQVASLVKDRHNILVIFDELFKGTNVKDAYDATLSVTEAFSTFRNCHYIISTHIIEVGETLRKQCANMQFRFMPTVMEGNTPRYPYIMKEGITVDRHGMTIIENEKIMEIMLG